MKKKKLVSCLTICSSAFLFSFLPRYTFADSPTTLKPAHDGGSNIAFVDKNDLSQNERNLIRPIQDGEKVKQCSIYRLVYEKVESTPSFLEKEVLKELPNTGSITSWGEIFLGTSLMSVGFFAIVKNRKGKQHLVLLLVLAGGSLITYGGVGASQTVAEISNRIMIATGEKLEAPAIDKYRFVGIIETEGQCQIVSLPPTFSPEMPTPPIQPALPSLNIDDIPKIPEPPVVPTLPELELPEIPTPPIQPALPSLNIDDIPKIPEPPVVPTLPELELPEIPTPPIQPALPSLNIDDIPKIPEPPVVPTLPELELPEIPTPPIQPALPSLNIDDIPENPPATLEKPIGKIPQSKVHVRIEAYRARYNGLVPLSLGNEPGSSNSIDLGEYDVYRNIDEVNEQLKNNSDVILSLVNNTYNIDAVQEVRKAAGYRYLGRYIGLVDDSDPISGSFVEGKDIVIKLKFVENAPQ